MSISTKNLFKRCTAAQHATYVDRLALSPPNFLDDGFTTTALMSGRGGKVELRCGPADYEVELFIHVDSGGERLSLRDLIALPSVLDWMKVNRPALDGKQRIEVEIAYAFRLLNEVIGRVPKMDWLLQKSPSPPC